MIRPLAVLLLAACALPALAQGFSALKGHDSNAPIDISSVLNRILFPEDRICLLTSATLSVGQDDLAYFRSRVGAFDVEALQVGSPFDYEKQMRLYVAKKMPDPRDSQYEDALEKWIASSGKKRADYLFSAGTSGSRPIGERQLSRLVKSWVVEAGLDPTGYGLESLRRTKALHILKGTGDLQTVRALLGHVKIESTARYLGIETQADPIAICRAFDI